VRVAAPETLADEVAGGAGSDTLGVTVHPAGAGSAEISFYVEDRGAADRLRDRISSLLRALGAPADPRTFAIAEIVDPGWVESYQARLRPLPLGDRFVVLPGVGHEVPPGRDPIHLVPGRAFGTGEHPTTRLCAAELEREVAPGSRWLDVGTGSGVLAVVASRCGAAHARGIDVDPDAVAVAREVVAANLVAGAPVSIALGEVAEEEREAWDGVVANVSEQFAMTSTAALARVLRPGGRLVVSGFLREDAADVDRALVASGFELDRSATEGPWAVRVARRRVGDRSG
jgi:ribosomal protein L11 methyltransferase